VLSSKQQQLKDSVCITMSSVWVQIYYKGEAKPVGEADPIEIDPMPKNVNALKMKVKASFAARLAHCDFAELQVYEPGTAVPVPTETVALTSWKDVPAGSTGPSPLIVVAPKPQQQNGKLRCCFRIHVFKCLLLRIRKLVSSNRECFALFTFEVERRFNLLAATILKSHQGVPHEKSNLTDEHTNNLAMCFPFPFNSAGTKRDCPYVYNQVEIQNCDGV
jgi:hypothetical protein